MYSGVWFKRETIVKIVEALKSDVVKKELLFWFVGNLDFLGYVS